MHYLGAITEQLTREDPQVELARRHARQRRDARRARRARQQTPTERHLWWASRTRDRGQEDIGRKPLWLFDWQGLLAHRR